VWRDKCDIAAAAVGSIVGGLLFTREYRFPV
jgi:hypothetical protein